MGLSAYNPAHIIDSARSLHADAATRAMSPDRAADANIHEIRKDLKKVRAYWRLMRFALGKRHSQAGNQRCKEAAQQLASARDHVVMLGTLDELGRDADPAVAMALGQAKQAMLQAVGDTVTRRIDWQKVSDLLRNDDAAWSGLAPARIDPADIKRGWKRTRRKAREHYRQARERPEPEALHAWRKWAKRWLQQEQLLHPSKKGRIDTLDQLSDLLGLHHDCAVLAHRLWRNDQFGGRPQQRVRQALAQRQADLEKQSLRLGRKIFA